MHVCVCSCVRAHVCMVRFTKYILVEPAEAAAAAEKRESLLVLGRCPHTGQIRRNQQNLITIFNRELLPQPQERENYPLQHWLFGLLTGNFDAIQRAIPPSGPPAPPPHCVLLRSGSIHLLPSSSCPLAK